MPVTTVKVLVIGGGGGGGESQNGFGGGGGAGGYQYDAAFVVTPKIYTVTIGAGGIGGVNGAPWTAPTNGGDSIFSTINADGGGAGGTDRDGVHGNGADGGCGGGGSGHYYNGLGGAGSQGFDGGAGSSTGGANAGGGGGSSQDGFNGNSGGGFGGLGTDNTITGATVTYCVGGGGGSTNGQGVTDTEPGAGGGGAESGSGSDGLDGIVLVRWTTSNFGICSVTGVGNAISTIGADSLATMIVDGDLNLGYLSSPLPAHYII